MLMGTSTIALKALEDLYKPVICAINGYALGGGCELAMACDIRIATGRSKFGQPETSLSIIPGAGGTQRLARLVGVGRAKELIYTGRIITAEEAKLIGLVNQVTGDTREELMEAAKAMAEQIMKKGPVATRLAKMAINVGMDTDINTGLLFERIAQTVAFGTEDRKEGTHFGCLTEYKKAAYYQEHPYIEFDTLYGDAKYEVFAAFAIDVVQDTSFVYNQYVDMDEDTYNDYVAEVIRRSDVDSGIRPEYGEQLLTLSTCEYSSANGRYVVVARKVSS